MAYTYNPYEYKSTVGQRPVWYPEYSAWNSKTGQTGPQWDMQFEKDQRSQFQDYAGQQFKGLFDAANANLNPLQGFAQTPMYTPSVSASDFSTPAYSGWGTDPSDGSQTLWKQYPATFDQQGYNAAQFSNINDYLGSLSSFLGNMSGSNDPSAGVRQGEAQRAMYLASLPQMPTMQPMQQSTHTGGGWGQQSPVASSTPMTYRQQAPAGILGTTNRGLYGGILGGQQGV